MALTQVDGGLLNPNNAQYTGFKNRIINGAMVIDQRNAGASVSTGATSYFNSALYTVDRWNALCSATSKYTAQQTPSATETGYATRVAAGFTNYLAATSSSAYSVGAGDYFGFGQRIEGFNTADLAWGTASAQAVTVSAWVYSSLTGTFGGAVTNNAGNRSYPFTYSIPVANTWTKISVTIPGDTSGTWVGASNSTGIQLTFMFGVGSTYSGAAGAWASALYMSATGAQSIVGTNGATFYITGVQLEKGSTATSFDYRPYGTELALCKRYYNTATSQPLGLAVSGYGYFGEVCFPVTMRAAPTVTGSYVANNGGTVGTFSITTQTADGFAHYCSSNNLSVNYQYSVTYSAPAEL